MKKILVVIVILSALTLPALAQRSLGRQQRRQQRREAHVAKKFAKLDRNSDGKISRDEWTRKPKAFDRLDLNHDGFITIDEIKEARQQRRGR